MYPNIGIYQLLMYIHVYWLSKSQWILDDGGNGRRDRRVLGAQQDALRTVGQADLGRARPRAPSFAIPKKMGAA